MLSSKSLSILSSRNPSIFLNIIVTFTTKRILYVVQFSKIRYHEPVIHFFFLKNGYFHHSHYSAQQINLTMLKTGISLSNMVEIKDWTEIKSIECLFSILCSEMNTIFAMGYQNLHLDCFPVLHKFALWIQQHLYFFFQ
jgi:hypothetical protein